jgi:hypothetical protein
MVSRIAFGLQAAQEDLARPFAVAGWRASDRALACHWAGAGAALRDIFGLMFANCGCRCRQTDGVRTDQHPAYSSLSGYIVSKRRYRPQRRRCFNVPAPLLSLTSGAGLNEDSMKLPSVISSAD